MSLLTPLAFEEVQGDHLVYALAVTGADGVGLNLNNYSIWFTLKDDLSKTDANAIIQKTKGAGITIDGSINSKALITLTSGDTNVLDQYERLFFDTQIMDSSDQITTVKRGNFKFLLGATKNTS